MYVGGFNFDFGLFFKVCFIILIFLCLFGGLFFLFCKKRFFLSFVVFVVFFGFKFKGFNRFFFFVYFVFNFIVVFFVGFRVVGVFNEFLCSINVILIMFFLFLIFLCGIKVFLEDEVVLVFDIFFVCMDFFKLFMSC